MLILVDDQGEIVLASNPAKKILSPARTAIMRKGTGAYFQDFKTQRRSKKMSICCFLVAMLQVIHCRLDHGSAVAANGGVVNDLSLGSHLHISPTWSDTSLQ